MLAVGFLLRMLFLCFLPSGVWSGQPFLIICLVGPLLQPNPIGQAQFPQYEAPASRRLAHSALYRAYVPVFPVFSNIEHKACSQPVCTTCSGDE